MNACRSCLSNAVHSVYGLHLSSNVPTGLDHNDMLSLKLTHQPSDNCNKWALYDRQLRVSHKPINYINNKTNSLPQLSSIRFLQMTGAWVGLWHYSKPWILITRDCSAVFLLRDIYDQSRRALEHEQGFLKPPSTGKTQVLWRCLARTKEQIFGWRWPTSEIGNVDCRLAVNDKQVNIMYIPLSHKIPLRRARSLSSKHLPSSNLEV